MVVSQQEVQILVIDDEGLMGIKRVNRGSGKKTWQAEVESLVGVRTYIKDDVDETNGWGVIIVDWFFLSFCFLENLTKRFLYFVVVLLVYEIYMMNKSIICTILTK